MRKIVSFLLIAVFLILPVSAASSSGTDVEYIQKSSFWNWLAGKPGTDWNKFVGYTFGNSCPNSDDGYHHASSYKRPQASWGGLTGYYTCICDLCGAEFTAYESDLQQSYEAQVEELPATGYQSDGSLLYTPSHKYLSFHVASSIYCGHYVGSSTTYVSATFDCDADLILIYPGNGSSDFQCQSYKGVFSFVAPVSGTYYVIKTPCRTGYYIDSSGAKYDVSTNWTENNGVHYSAGYSFDDVNSYSSLKSYPDFWRYRYHLYWHSKGGEKMNDLAVLFTKIVDLFSLEFTLYGFTFSLWEVFLFSAVVGIVARILGEIFFGD